MAHNFKNGLIRNIFSFESTGFTGVVCGSLSFITAIFKARYIVASPSSNSFASWPMVAPPVRRACIASHLCSLSLAGRQNFTLFYFALHSVDLSGKVLLKNVSRKKFSETTINIPPCLIGMKACASAHYCTRLFKQFGHDIKFVPIKSIEQQSILSVNKARERLVRLKRHLVVKCISLLTQQVEVTVEIDHDKWFGQSVTPTTKVQIIGEIDKSMSGVNVGADVIKIL